MSDRPQPLHIRIFLSSPGDVSDERSVALQSSTGSNMMRSCGSILIMLLWCQDNAAAG